MPVGTVQMNRPSSATASLKSVARIANGFVHRPYNLYQQSPTPPPQQPQKHHHQHHHHHSQNRPKQILSPTGMMAVKYRCLPVLDKSPGFNYHNGDKVDSSSSVNI